MPNNPLEMTPPLKRNHEEPLPPSASSDKKPEIKEENRHENTQSPL